MDFLAGTVVFLLLLLVIGLLWRRTRRSQPDGQARLEALLGATGLGQCVRDADGRMHMVNAEFKRIVGISSPAQGEDWLQILPEEDRAALMRAWTVLPALPDCREVRLPEAEGLERWGRFCYAPLSGGRWLVTVEDVSARYLADQIRLESEQRFAKLFYLLPAVAAITEVETGRFVDVNHMWEPVYGYRREETIGHTSTELGVWLKPEDRQGLVDAITREGTVHGYSYQARRKDGGIIDCSASGSLIELHGQKLLFLVVRDVTEELRVARVLRESEAKFSSIFHQSLTPLLVSRVSDGMILECNQAWSGFMGMSSDRMLGHSALALGVWPDPREREEIVAQVLREGGVNRAECHLGTDKGAVRLCVASCRRLELNGTDCLLWNLQDITEQRAMETAIQNVNATLELRVQERTGELEQANRELQQANDALLRAQDELVRSEKLAALGGLVAGVAHELNTPIGNSVTAASALQWRTEQFRQTLADGLLKRSMLEDYLDYAITGSQLLMRSLEQAHDLVASFKQVAVDRTGDLRRRFNLAGLIEELLRTHHSAICHSGCKVDVVVDVAPDLMFDSFPGSLGQVIGNFIGNALLHAFEGREQGQILIRGQRSGEDHVELCFGDDGVGIPTESLKRIFDPFYTTKFGQGGSGLGLHIAYNIVTGVLGGQIRVTSELGQGTRFMLDLPLMAPVGAVANPMQVPELSEPPPEAN